MYTCCVSMLQVFISPILIFIRWLITIRFLLLNAMAVSTMRGRPPIPHWMMLGPGHYMPAAPQQTIKEAFFDPTPGCPPHPYASSSPDRVNPFEEE